MIEKYKLVYKRQKHTYYCDNFSEKSALTSRCLLSDKDVEKFPIIVKKNWQNCEHKPSYVKTLSVKCVLGFPRKKIVNFTKLYSRGWCCKRKKDQSRFKNAKPRTSRTWTLSSNVRLTTDLTKFDRNVSPNTIHNSIQHRSSFLFTIHNTEYRLFARGTEKQFV